MKYLLSCIGGLLLFGLGMLVNRTSAPVPPVTTSSLITYMAQLRNGGQFFGEIIATGSYLTAPGVVELKNFILSRNTNLVTNSVIIMNVLPVK